MRIVVTGASGFVGRATVRVLREAGHEVVPVVRRAPDDAAAGPELKILPDQTEEARWRPVVANVDAVVHLVAHAHQGERTGSAALAEFRRVNVDITRALAIACRQTEVPRMVYLSSAKVFGEGSRCDASGKPEAFRAETPPAPEGPYGASKLEAEQILVRELNATALSILRPPLIYGPGMRANLLSLLRAVSRQIPLPFASLQNRRSLVHRNTVVDAIGHCLQPAASQPGTRIFTLADLTLSTPELVVLMAAGLGVPARLFAFPEAGLRALGKLSGRGAQVERLVGSFVIDGSAAARDLALPTPPTGEVAWREIARIFRAGEDVWRCA